MKPQRVQLSRKKGWRMPPNTVKVDRTTKWGNPAIVGIDGPAAECVYLYVLMLVGYIVCKPGVGDRQQVAAKALAAEKKAGWPKLRGKNLACWCPVGKPCHGDVLLHIANKKPRAKLDMDKIMSGYGYRMENGTAVKINAAVDVRAVDQSKEKP